MRDTYKFKRNIFLSIMSISISYRTYLQYESENIYSDYGSTFDESALKHDQIDELDKQKPLINILSGITIIPAYYYHAKYLEMNQWLKN